MKGLIESVTLAIHSLEGNVARSGDRTPPFFVVKVPRRTRNPEGSKNSFIRFIFAGASKGGFRFRYCRCQRARPSATMMERLIALSYGLPRALIAGS